MGGWIYRHGTYIISYYQYEINEYVKIQSFKQINLAITKILIIYSINIILVFNIGFIHFS